MATRTVLKISSFTPVYRNEADFGPFRTAFFHCDPSWPLPDHLERLCSDGIARGASEGQGRARTRTPLSTLHGGCCYALGPHNIATCCAEPLQRVGGFVLSQTGYTSARFAPKRLMSASRVNSDRMFLHALPVIFYLLTHSK